MATTGLSRLEGYLQGLPQGADSHPECVGRGTLMLNVLQTNPLTPPELARLPPFVRAYFEKPPLHASWVPEVHIWSTVFAVGDVKGLDARAFAAWSLESNRRLCEGLRLKVQLDILNSAQSAEMGAMTWTTTHHGTRLEVVGFGPEHTLARLEFPKNLLNLLALECLAGAFVAILDATKPGRGNGVKVTGHSETWGEFRTTWTKQ